jgi:hypothetical protein
MKVTVGSIAEDFNINILEAIRVTKCDQNEFLGMLSCTLMLNYLRGLERDDVRRILHELEKCVNMSDEELKRSR